MGRQAGFRATLLAATVAGLPGAVLAQRDWFQLEGIIENFYRATPASHGPVHRLSWVELKTDLNAKVGLVGTLLVFPNREVLDETYFRLTLRDVEVRAGRLRSAFGHSGWSEAFYTPVINTPMARSAQMLPGVAILRFDTGIDIRGGGPQLQYQAGLIDVSNATWQIAPDRPEYGVIRLQTQQGDVILGLNALNKVSGQGANDSQIYGVDFRWTKERVEVRAELVQGKSSGPVSKGYYVDLFYRPPNIPKMKLALRAETLDSLVSGETVKLYTVGVMHSLTQNFRLFVNYGWGSSAAPAGSMRGWSTQLMTAARF